MAGQASKHEYYISGLLFAFFFLVIAVFQLLKPIKSGLFVAHYGANIELYAKLSNIVVAGLGVMVFTLLYDKLKRHHLLYALSAFFLVLFSWLAHALHEPSAFTIWGFYLLGDLEATVMVAGFWAYLTDLANPSQAKRLFGPIGAGGVLGGWGGVSIAKVLLETLGTPGLLLVASAMMGLVILVIFLAESLIRHSNAFRPATRLRLVPKEEGTPRVALAEAFEGARLVARSRYLLAIAGILVFYEIASQLMDYQFKLAAQELPAAHAMQAFMTDIYFYANTLSVLVQFFLVGAVMKRFGLAVALLILPVAVIGGSVGLFVLPTIVAASLLVIFDNGLNYSIQQTGRESLYLITTPEEKYKARAFIQMFLQRLAKGFSVLVVIGLGALGAGTMYLSVITVGIMILMAAFGLYAGRHFSRVTEAEERRPVESTATAPDSMAGQGFAASA